MRISIICFSLTGYMTAEDLQKDLQGKGYTAEIYKKSKYLDDSIAESTGIWAGRHFETDDAIIFVGACGIAVRSIAPYVASKKSDPAVLVIDECGKFVISLLSGHLGGANELTLEVAELLGAVPVVTTATDLHHRFAVDVFAKKNCCGIQNMKAAKEVSAALLAGEPVGFYSEFPWEGDLPDGLMLCGKDGIPSVTGQMDESAGEVPETGIAVTLHRGCLPFSNTVHVVPPVAVLGMGCRKGKDAASIQSAAIECLQEADLYKEALHSIASIDLKKEEPGLLSLAESWHLLFETFTEEELKTVKGEFTPSKFVKKITGVDNVCERSAVLASGQGTLIRKKTGRDGVTTALAAGNRRIRFE